MPTSGAWRPNLRTGTRTAGRRAGALTKPATHAGASRQDEAPGSQRHPEPQHTSMNSTSDSRTGADHAQGGESSPGVFNLQRLYEKTDTFEWEPTDGNIAGAAFDLALDGAEVLHHRNTPVSRQTLYLVWFTLLGHTNAAGDVIDALDELRESIRTPPEAFATAVEVLEELMLITIERNHQEPRVRVAPCGVAWGAVHAEATASHKANAKRAAEEKGLEQS